MIRESVYVSTGSFSQNVVLIKELSELFSDIKFNSDAKKFSGSKFFVFNGNSNSTALGMELVNAHKLEQCPNLKFIEKFSAEIDNINFEGCKKMGMKAEYTSNKEEPLTNKSQLQIPNLITTLHIYGNSFESVLAMGRGATH